MTKCHCTSLQSVTVLQCKVSLYFSTKYHCTSVQSVTVLQYKSYKQYIYRINTTGNICNYKTYCVDQVLNTNYVHTGSAIRISLFPLTIVLLIYINVLYIFSNPSCRKVSHNTELCCTTKELSATWCVVLVNLFTRQVHDQP